MLMSKNVNNDVSKDSPIQEINFLLFFVAGSYPSEWFCLVSSILVGF